PRPTACKALRTLSRLSATALSGRPTMAKTCCPPLIRTCTSTAFASMPTNATVEIWPYMAPPTLLPQAYYAARGASTTKCEHRGFLNFQAAVLQASEFREEMAIDRLPHPHPRNLRPASLKPDARKRPAAAPLRPQPAESKTLRCR